MCYIVLTERCVTCFNELVGSKRDLYNEAFNPGQLDSLQESSAACLSILIFSGRAGMLPVIVTESSSKTNGCVGASGV